MFDVRKTRSHATLAKAPLAQAPLAQATLAQATLALVICLLPVPALTEQPTAWAQDSRAAPEASTGHTIKGVVTASKTMIAAANPLAVEAGRTILRMGGSAVDAAIAVQLVLNLVEPQSSGIGGGAFLLHWDNQNRELKTYDGRETAPKAATSDRFLLTGKPMPFRSAVKSGLSVGVPGLVKLLEYAHARHGKLPWSELFSPAIQLATNGFPISQRLHRLLWLHTAAPFSPAARRYFFAEPGTTSAPHPHPVGYILKNPEFAATLTAIRDHGAAAFYSSLIADAIVEAVNTAQRNAGDMTAADLRAYHVKERPSICTIYRRYQVCGMGPPSSGGLTVAQALKMIERFDLGRGIREALNPQAMHLMSEALKLSFADRNRYIADTDFVAVPHGLLDEVYLARRAKLIDPSRAMKRPSSGIPPGAIAGAFGHDATRESIGTSHISIIDGDGNAVSMTSTIESAFGSGLWAAGFLLNNELTDFSFRPTDKAGRPIANRVEPEKRPRSSMAPTLIFDPDGDLHSVLGSPGGSRIILYVLKAVVGLIDWQLDAQAVASLRNFGSRGQGFTIEYGEALTTDVFASLTRTPSIWHGLQMRAFAHRVRPALMTSGLHIVHRAAGGLQGGADPRREGIALGD